MFKQQTRLENLSSLTFKRPLPTGETTVSALEKSSLASYTGSSDGYSYSYSYSYSATDSPSGTETITTLSDSSRSMVDNTEPKLPPRVPHPPLRLVQTKANQSRPGEVSCARPTNAPSDLSDSYGYGSSYSYSYGNSDEEVDENSASFTGSYSYSYSYSTESTDNDIDSIEKLKQRVTNQDGEITTSSSSQLPFGDAMKRKSGGTDTFNVSSYSYTGTVSESGKVDLTGSGVTGSSDYYSGSYGELATGRAASLTALSTMTKDSQYSTGSLTKTRGSKKYMGNSSIDDGSYSYSYSYSCDSKDTTGLPSRHYGSVSRTSTGESKMSFSVSDTQTESMLISMSTDKLNKVMPHLDHAIQRAAAKTPTTTTTSVITSDMWRGSESVSHDEISSVHTRSKESFTDGVTSTEDGVSSQLLRTRSVTTLVAPPDESPRIRSLPPICVVPRGSINDTLSRFLEQFLIVQSDVLQREADRKAAVLTLRSSEVKLKKEKKTVKSKKGELEMRKEEDSTTVIENIPSDHFVKKCLKFALKAVGVESAEERALVVKNAVVPLNHDATLALLSTYAHKSITQRVTSMFLAHDKFYSGEVPLGLTLELLGLCGIAYQNIDDVELSLCTASPKGRVPLLRVCQRMPSRGPPIATIEGGEPPTPEREINEKIVDVCGGVLRVPGVDVYFDERKGDLYIGNCVVVKMITSRTIGMNIVMQINALIHVCLAVHACTVEDRMSCTVLYTPLISALLSLTPNGVSNATSIVFENALVSVLNPEKQLEKLSAHRRLQKRYLGDGEDGILLDTLPDRRGDAEGTTTRKVCQHLAWAPGVSADGRSFENAGSMTFNNTCCELDLIKLRLREAVPIGARCYCLVSMKKSSNDEWLPALIVPVSTVKASKKGGYKWTFDKDPNSRMLFAGEKFDRLCVEACYDVVEANGETVTWCAGHVLIACSEVKGGKLPILRGSIISDVIPSFVDTKVVNSSKGFFCFSGKKKDAISATSLTVVVRTVKEKSLSSRHSLPVSFVAFRRHVPLIAQLLDAVMSISDCRVYPLQVLRQQQVRNCLALTVTPSLMDVLQELWDRTLAGKMGTKPKNLLQRQRAILALACKIVAVNNNVDGNQKLIADVVARGAAIPVPMSPLAPQRPIHV